MLAIKVASSVLPLTVHLFLFRHFLSCSPKIYIYFKFRYQLCITVHQSIVDCIQLWFVIFTVSCCSLFLEGTYRNLAAI